MKIELLYFEGCANHYLAEEMLAGVLSEFGVRESIEKIDVPDAEKGKLVTFPGSPTIRIDGADVEPDWQPCDDCTPRCRLYMTAEGLKGLPERDWIVQAVNRSIVMNRKSA